MFGSDVDLVVGGLAVGLIALNYASRRWPHIGWLQHFRWAEFSAAQQRTMRRRAGIHTGVKFILLGLVLPLGYVAVTVMMFKDFTPTSIALVALSSAASIGLGIFTVARNARG